MVWIKKRIELPKKVSSKAARELIAAEVIEFIKGRTKKGLGPSGKPWPGKAKQYSKEYQKKKGSSLVDLTNKDEMLQALKLLSSNNKSLLIGYDNGTKENDKAEGNILGTYGQPSPIPGKARDFLGINKKTGPIQKKQLKEIVNAVIEDK